MTRRRILRTLAGTSLVLVVLITASLLHPRVRYVLTAASYQLELLVGRVPLERALRDGEFTAEQRARLEQVPKIRAFAARQGLAESGHYSTINPTWSRTVYNVSACEPLAFSPRTWWFPIVGTVPYLGFFDEEIARAEASDLRASGLDVYVRTAGAWSTLGWFEDPLLPAMADWDEGRLANTLLHELTHATVWIPGSVAFNESLASFVGDVASRRYLEEVYGPDSEPVRAAAARRADSQRFQQLMHDTYQELEALYTSDRSDHDKRQGKQTILGELPRRVRDAGFADPDRWVAWVEREPWNNARLVQYRVYNRSPEWFAIVLDEHGGDLPSFLHAIEALGRSADDPYAALATAAGAEPEADPNER